MVLKLYIDFLSQPSRVLYIFLKSCNIPFDTHIVHISKGDHRTEEYEKINPFCRVPAIEHNGFQLIESIAIARYICREFKVAEHWYPSASQNQARLDEYLEWQHLNIRMHCSRYFLALFTFPLLKQKSPHPERVKECTTNLVDVLDKLENKWLKSKPFLLGDEVSLADLFAACELEQSRMAGYDPREGRPKLAQWMQRIVDATAPHYVEAHRQLEEVIKRIGGRSPEECTFDEVFP